MDDVDSVIQRPSFSKEVPKPKTKREASVKKYVMRQKFLKLRDLQKLLKDGKNINFIDEKGKSGLHHACIQGDVVLVKHLLLNGAYLNALCNRNRTALHYACIHQHVPVVALLIDHKIFLDSQDKVGKAAIHYAVEKGDTFIVHMLLTAGADIHLLTTSKKTPLDLAIQSKKSFIVEDIVKKETSSQEKMFPDVPSLPELLELEQYNMATILINAGVDINGQDERGNAPLHHACLHGNLPIISHLLNKNALVSDINHNLQTPLHFAAKQENPLVAFMLLQSQEHKKVLLSAQDINGATPLHIAVMEEKTEVLRYLLDESDADILNLPDYKSRTLLHYLCVEGGLRFILELTERKVNTEVVDINGFTPLHCAAINHEQTTEAMLDAGASLEARDKEKRSALHLAVIKQLPGVVKTLVRRGINLNTFDASGNTALHYAVSHTQGASIEIIHELMKSGADLSTQNKNGHTPLHVACLMRRKEVVQEIVRNVVDPSNKYSIFNIVDNDGKIPLDYADTDDEICRILHTRCICLSVRWC